MSGDAGRGGAGRGGPTSARVELLGCPFDPVTLEQAVERAAAYVRGSGFGQACGVNVDLLVRMEAEPEFASMVRACELITADGMPVVWASRLLGRPLPGRVPAIDLFLSLLPRCAAEGWPVFLLGATREVVTAARAALELENPGLIVAGARHGWFARDEEEDVAVGIASSGARMLFVAISSPKKEAFVARNRHRLGDVAFVVGVGGAFDIAAGRVRRAPAILRRTGLEWTWRLAWEPRRLARRYLVDDRAFLGMVARAMRERGRIR